MRDVRGEVRPKGHGTCAVNPQMQCLPAAGSRDRDRPQASDVQIRHNEQNLSHPCRTKEDMHC